MYRVLLCFVLLCLCNELLVDSWVYLAMYFFNASLKPRTMCISSYIMTINFQLYGNMSYILLFYKK